MQRNHLSLFIFIFWLVPNAFAQQINGFTPKQIIGGKGEVLTITGTGFGNNRGSSYVSFFREGNTYTDATTGNGFNYISWTNTEIKLEMPVAFSNKIKVNIAGTDYLSADTLKVKANLGYRQANPLLYDLLTDNNKNGGVTWFVHPVYWNNPEIKQAIADVVQEFRCKTGVNYIIEPLTQWTPLNLGQGKHIIAPDSSLGVVGFNDRLWASCIVGAETFYHNQTQLLRFNTQQNWYYGKGQPPAGAAKFRYVMFHEMGHSLGLGHVNEEGESMYPTVTLLPSDNWCSRDTITSSERKAIQHYIGMSQNFVFRGCGITPMKVNSDCKDVYGLNLSAGTLATEGAWLFPNPASTHIQLNLPSRETTEMSIWDIQGRPVLKQQLQGTAQIELPRLLRNGVYIIRINTGGVFRSTQLLIQR